MPKKKTVIGMPNTEKGRAYVKARRLLDEALSLMEKHGRVTAQILVMELVGRAVQQEVPKETVLKMVGETYDWIKGMQGMSTEEVLKQVFGEGN